MMKIVASLVILGLCANVAFGLGAAPIVTSQSGGFSSSVLNSTAIQILKGTNSTDAANWDSSSTTTAVAGVISVYFGAGATNDTSYLWGITYPGQSSTATTGDGSCGTTGNCDVYTLSTIRKRTINNTVVGWGNDTSEASVLSDTTVSATVLGEDVAFGTGPGYLAILSAGIDSAATPNNQVWITLVSGAAGSASTTKLTTTSDTIYVNTAGTTPAVGAACVATTFGVGNVWYDRGTGAFFYTYWKNVATSAATTGSAGTCGAITNSYSIYLGGIYANGTALLTTPISVAAVTPTASVHNLIGGVDNTNAASYVWLAYKDTTAATVTTYVSKTAISANTTAVGSFSALVKDSATTAASSTTAGTNVAMTYTPAVIWSSNNSYAVTVMNATTSVVWSGSSAPYTSATTISYGYVNYFNGTTTGVDAGVTVASTSGTPAGYQAWQLNTGYTVVSGVTAASGSPAPTTYSVATFYANGTVNATSATAGTLSYGAPQFYEDINGTQWIGWYDVDTANSQMVYNAYLAKFQGQLNIPSGASILSAISAFFALFLAAIFVF